jgi:hypothetical protein
VSIAIAAGARNDQGTRVQSLRFAVGHSRAHILPAPGLTATTKERCIAMTSPAEAKAIRQVMAIRKRRKPSGEARRDLDRHFSPDISTVLAAHIHFSG